jgi:uncharacterized membrane protein YgcG
MRSRSCWPAALGLLGLLWGGSASKAEAQLFKHRLFGRDPQPAPIIPAPLGSSVRSWQDMQATLAAQDQFVIYLHEWYTAKVLGPYGRFHLQRIAEKLSDVPFPVVIQPDLYDAKLNEARRTLVIAELTAKGITDAPQRVLIAMPIAEGLFGDEAVRVYSPIIGGGGAGGGSRGTFGGFGTSGGGGSGGGGMGSFGGIRGY